jgi:RNA-directed DNA polymerase
MILNHTNRCRTRIIRGWANYYSTGVSNETFSKLDHLIWQCIERWCQRRHPRKSAQWVKDKYFKTVGDRNWVFSDGTYTLTTHTEVPIVRHIKVRGNKSPYDGDMAYWAGRRGKHPQLPTTVAKLLKTQKGKCKHCGLTFREGDLWEVDHIIPSSLGGNNSYSNSFTVIAMTIRQPLMEVWDVPMKRVRLLRSRMKRKFQVRF